LLKAALQLFGERGFDAVGIRELATAAGVNIAAINYHFGTKEQLRLEALRHGLEPTLTMREETQGYLDEAGKHGSTSAAEGALRKYIHRFLKEILATNSAHWSLLMREFTMPSPSFDVIIGEYLEPVDAILVQILRLLLPGADEMTLSGCAGSIIGQCFHAKNSAAIVRRTMGIDVGSPLFAEWRADYIADFSLMGITGLRQKTPRTEERQT
jgi:AcrR family transcriptional regulator